MSYRLVWAGEKLDFSNDWSSEADDLGSPSDTISSSTWTIAPQDNSSPAEPTVFSTSIDGTTTKAIVGNFRAGEIYLLNNSVKWASGAPDPIIKVIELRCENPGV